MRSILASLCIVVLVLAGALSALAQPSASRSRNQNAAPAPAAPTPARPSSDAAPQPLFAAVIAGVPIRLTGIVHATVIGTQGVQSYGFLNATAATSAANPAVLASPEEPYLTFQVQQTRLGLIAGEGTPLRAQVEIDFIHFDQSSPTVQAFPRIRIGLLEWHFEEGHRLFLGQTWDLFGNTGAPLLSHSFNLVGTLFQAGNVGFMRHQLGWSGRFGELELAVAAGLAGANFGPTFDNLEQAFSPTGSARVMVHLGQHGVIGVSGLGTALRMTRDPGMEERRLALGGELFADLRFGPLNLRAEAYIAQNLANLGALDIGQGRFGADVADAGGYLSARLTLEQHAITAMFGGAAVLDPSQVIPAYEPSRDNPDRLVPNVRLGPGMHFNMSAHAAYWYSPVPHLSIVLEPCLFVTRFQLRPEEAGRLEADQLAFGAQLGGMFQF